MSDRGSAVLRVLPSSLPTCDTGSAGLMPIQHVDEAAIMTRNLSVGSVIAYWTAQSEIKRRPVAAFARSELYCRPMTSYRNAQDRTLSSACIGLGRARLCFLEPAEQAPGAAFGSRQGFGKCAWALYWCHAEPYCIRQAVAPAAFGLALSLRKRGGRLFSSTANSSMRQRGISGFWSPNAQIAVCPIGALCWAETDSAASEFVPGL